MGTERSVTLIAPHVRAAMSRAMRGESGRWPGLARIAGRGAVQVCEPNAGAGGLDPWQLELLRALALDAAAAQLPDAAVRAAADAQAAAQVTAQEWWIAATPLHLAVGLDHLAALTLTAEAAVSEAERAALAQAIAAHLQAEGLELRTSARGEWLLRSDRPVQASTVSPRVATSTALEDAMPQGPSAPWLHRVMTELQMLLHEHPVNLARLSRGAPAINAVWLHGAGAIGELRPQPLPAAFGSDAYLVGLYRLHGCQPPARTADPSAVAAHAGGAVVAVLDGDELDEIEERWAPAMTQALWSGRVQRLVMVLDRWRVLVQRRSLFMPWRRPLELSRWPAC